MTLQQLKYMVIVAEKGTLNNGAKELFYFKSVFIRLSKREASKCKFWVQPYFFVVGFIKKIFVFSEKYGKIFI